MKVDSSYIRSWDYDSAARRFVVVFRDGAEIAYSDVHPRTYQAILNADSHGEKFHELMAGKKYVVINK